ncbi:MAG: lipase maturation factor family protein, partial [Planctomycetota bacterium]
KAPPRGGEHWLTRFVVLRLLGLVYFFAFLSLANQVLPLIGSRGLLPAGRYLEAVREQAGGSAWAELPSLLWLSHSDATLQTLAWVGVGLSVPLLAGFANALLLAALWVLYLSFVHVGQVWYGYGWEIQLLETGFLAIFLCPLLDPRPFPRRPPPFAVLLCLRWLIVRIMLGAGLIKIRGDPCWRDLTRLLSHYETQPIPNPLSRVLHFLPPWLHRVECLWNHLVELVAPWFAFGPFAARRNAAFLFLAFQILLILSDNLSFLNHLTIVTAPACLDDGVWRRLLPRRLVAAADRARPSRAQGVVAVLLAVLVGVLSYWPVRNLLSSRQAMNTSFNQLHLVNTYGAFGSVGRERDEIVLEGTEEESIGPDTRWRSYEFKAKPTDPD